MRTAAVAAGFAVGAGTFCQFPALAGGLEGVGPSGGIELQVGGAVGVAPKYEGGKDYEVIGFPFIAPAGFGGDGVVQFKAVDDVRFRVLQQNGFEAGPLAGWRFDRDQDDAARLNGLGDIEGGLVVGGYAAYRLGQLLPFVSYHHQVTGDDTGGLVRFGIEAKGEVHTGLILTAVAGANYATDDYQDAYFSVTAAQSLASGLPVYDADSGIKDVFVGLTADVALTDLWTLKLTGRYSRLVGDAADSPVIETEDQFYGGAGLSYRFNLGN